MVHVTEELLLLAYDNEKGVDNSHTSLAYGLAGGVLLDLALRERIEISAGRVVVTDDSPLGNTVLDDALAKLAAAPRPKKPSSWMNAFYWGIDKRVRDGLIAQGVLRYQKGRALGLIPYSQYLPIDPTVEREVRERLENALRLGVPDTPKTAALAGIVHALWMEKKAVPTMPRHQARKSLKQVARQSPNSTVNASIQASRDAINMAVIAAVGAGAAAAGG